MATAPRQALAEGDNAVTLAFCWVHARQKHFDIQAANPAPIAGEALARSGGLYAIERDIRGARRFGAAGRPPSPRQTARRGDEALVGGQARRAVSGNSSETRRGDPLRAPRAGRA